MTKKIYLYTLLVLLLGAWAGCGGCGGCGDDQEEARPSSAQVEDRDRDEQESEPETIPEALEQAEEAMQEAFGESDVKASVDFRKLKDLLPEDVPGMDRTNAEGERNKFMGMEMSQATGDYRGDEGSMEISIVDLGTLSGLGRMGYAAWLNAEIDRESDRGYERTTKYKGFPALEKVERDGDRTSCDYSVWVGERFIVNIEGSNVEADQCEKARDRVDVKELDGMKSEGT